MRLQVSALDADVSRFMPSSLQSDRDDGSAADAVDTPFERQIRIRLSTRLWLRPICA